MYDRGILPVACIYKKFSLNYMMECIVCGNYIIFDFLLYDAIFHG